jgi:hypothetical protein
LRCWGLHISAVKTSCSGCAKLHNEKSLQVWRNTHQAKIYIRPKFKLAYNWHSP